MSLESRMFSSGSQVLYLPSHACKRSEMRTQGAEVHREGTSTHPLPKAQVPSRRLPGPQATDPRPPGTHLIAHPFHFTRYSMRP